MNCDEEIIETASRKPTVVDRHVGSRIRDRRNMLAGMSQAKLAERVGVTYQQIQKYERGVNRLSVSRLSQIAQILEVPIAYFFEENANTTISN
jgi:transcriptional regulator with XRE-family HTH domain